MRSHLWDSHSQRALFLPSFSWSPQETRNSQPIWMCPPGDHMPPPAHILSPWGPENSKRPQACLWAYAGLFPHPSSRDRDLLGGSGAAVEVCVRVDLGCGGWSGLEQPLTGSRGAEAGERSEVRMTLLTPPCFLVELQEARHSKLRPTCPIIMAVCCHDRRTGTFCFTVCSCDLYILPN